MNHAVRDNRWVENEFGVQADSGIGKSNVRVWRSHRDQYHRYHRHFSS